MTEINRPPYPGLRPFERNESDLFFGRDGCVDAMIARLEKTRFLAVLGSSGTGKSSLVKTGLLSALAMGLLAGSRWRVVEFRPGGDPLGRLAEALLQSEGAAATKVMPPAAEVQRLKARFKSEGPRELIKWCREGHLADGTNLLLLVDQFEEFFRYRNTEEREEAQAFISLLLESRWPRGVASPQEAQVPIYVTITMRSEYLGACALMLGLAEAINEGTYLTPRMTREQCEEAIIGPALVCGVEIEDRLVTRVLNDMADFAPWEEQRESKDRLSRLARQADQLPLMQYALNQMWRRAQETREPDGTIRFRLDDYLGLERELDARGDEVYDGLSDALKTTARKVFRAVTSGSTPANAERRPTRFGDLVKICGERSGDAVAEVIDKFGPRHCQFLTCDVPQTDNATVPDQAGIDISHESLIRQWSKLSHWVREEYRSAESYRDIERKAKLWNNSAGNLLTKLDLSMACRWWDIECPNAAWAERYGDAYRLALEFLRKSERHQFWRRGLASVGVIVPLVVVAGAVWLMFYEITVLLVGLVYLNPGYEFSDYSVPPQATLQQRVGTQTPTTIPGGHVVSTLELKEALDSGKLRSAPLILIDAWNHAQHPKIRNAEWIAYAGSPGNFHDTVQDRLAKKLDELTGGNRDMSIVFYCLGSECWESYNASLRAIYLGYSHVYWYRGGLSAWRQAVENTSDWATEQLRKNEQLSRVSVKPSTVLLYIPAVNRLIMHQLVQSPAPDQKVGKGRGDDAVGDFTKANARGRDEANKSHDDDAIADFTKAIVHNHENADYYYGRARAFANKDDYDDAMNDFIEAARLDSTKSADVAAILRDSKYASAYRNRGGVYSEKTDYDHAIADYTQAIKLDPKDAKAFAGRARAYFARGDYHRAVDDDERAIAISPRYAWAFFSSRRREPLRGLASQRAG
jgi:PQQ-dependent catabolism-associated CXXCW motif protein